MPLGKQGSFRSVTKVVPAQRQRMVNAVRVVRNLCVQSQSSLLGQLIKCKLIVKGNDKNAVSRNSCRLKVWLPPCIYGGLVCWGEAPTSPRNGKCFRTSLRGWLIGRTSSQLRCWWCPRGHLWVWRGSSCPAESPSVWWTEKGARLEPITHQCHFTGAFSCLFAVPGQHLRVAYLELYRSHLPP